VAAKNFEELVREIFQLSHRFFDFLMQKDERILTDRRQEKRDKKQTKERQKKQQARTEFF